MSHRHVQLFWLQGRQTRLSVCLHVKPYAGKHRHPSCSLTSSTRTHQLKSSKTHQLKNSQVQKLKNSKTQKLTNSSTHKLTNSSTHQLINSQTHQLKNSQTHQPTNSQTHQLINSQTHQLKTSHYVKRYKFKSRGVASRQDRRQLQNLPLRLHRRRCRDWRQLCYLPLCEHP